MQKYIAVLNPRMDKDDISRLIAEGVSGAIFQISHQNYPLAAQLISQVKEISKRYNKPVSLIQDASDMIDPLDLEFGLRSGVHWVIVSDPEQVKVAKKINHLTPLIWKGNRLPENLPVDSVMYKTLMSPDAQIDNGEFIKHGFKPHVKQQILESIRHFGDNSNAKAIAVADLEEAKMLSAMRPKQKIIFAPKDPEQAARGAIYWGVEPVFAGENLHSTIKNNQLLRKGERFIDARDGKHVTINFIS